MADQKQSPRQEEKATGHTERESKLRKRERRMQERLQIAQQAYDKAVERVKRAQARLQKRQARVRRLEERLTLLHQQAGEPSTSLSTSEAAPGSEKPQREDVSYSQEPVQEQELLAAELQVAATTEPAEDVQQEQELLAEELRVGATAPSESPLSISTGEIAEETPATTQSNQDNQPGIAQAETSGAPQSPLPLSPGEASGLARIARAVAETAERQQGDLRVPARARQRRCERRADAGARAPCCQGGKTDHGRALLARRHLLFAPQSNRRAPAVESNDKACPAPPAVAPESAAKPPA